MIEDPINLAEMVEDAIEPAQPFTPNRPHATALLGLGVLLALSGGLLTRSAGVVPAAG